MSNKKKIVSKPTIENSPYLYYGENNKVVAAWLYGQSKNTIMPVTFPGRRDITRLSKKYHGDTAPNKPFSNIIRFIAYWLTILITIPISIYAPFYFIGMIDTVLAVETTSSYVMCLILFLAALLIPASTLAFYMKTYPRLLEKNHENKYKFNRDDKKQLSEHTFLLIPKKLPNFLIEDIKNINREINSIFSFDDNIIEHVGMTDLQYHYNDYMNLLSFIVTNYDSISDELMQKYLDTTEEKSKKVMSLVKETIKFEEEYSQELEKIRKDKEKLQQKMLDDDALRAYYVE